MHDLGSMVCTKTLLCECTRPERANRLILHIPVYVLHCQLPNTKVSHGAACSLSQFARGHADAWPVWHRFHTDIVGWVHEPLSAEGLTLLAQLATYGCACTHAHSNL